MHKVIGEQQGAGAYTGGKASRRPKGRASCAQTYRPVGCYRISRERGIPPPSNEKLTASQRTTSSARPSHRKTLRVSSPVISQYAHANDRAPGGKRQRRRRTTHTRPLVRFPLLPLETVCVAVFRSQQRRGVEPLRSVEHGTVVCLHVVDRRLEERFGEVWERERGMGSMRGCGGRAGRRRTVWRRRCGSRRRRRRRRGPVNLYTLSEGFVRRTGRSCGFRDE